MYAVIRSGGQQFRVKAGDRIKINRLDCPLGKEVEFSEILFLGTEAKNYIGAPMVKGAKVSGVVVRQDKGDKILVLKKKRRQGYRRLKGHRQEYTELVIRIIESPEGEKSQFQENIHIFDPEAKRQRIAERQAKEESHASEAGTETPKKKASPVKAKKATPKKSAKKASPKKKSGAKTRKKSSSAKKIATKKTSKK